MSAGTRWFASLMLSFAASISPNLALVVRLRDLEAMWLIRRLTPDYRTIAAFRHDNPEAIVSVSAAFIAFCREQGLIRGEAAALDGAKMPVSTFAPCVRGAR